MLRTLIAALVATLPVAVDAARAGTTEDTADIDHLVAAYHQAVVGHDGARLAALFLPAGTAWFSVLTDDGLARVRTKTPNANRLRPGSVRSFVDMVASGRMALDPEHDDAQLRSDGTVASLWFRFRFLVDGREQNRGSESWQLVRADGGWRIASIVFSSTPPAP